MAGRGCIYMGTETKGNELYIHTPIAYKFTSRRSRTSNLNNPSLASIEMRAKGRSRCLEINVRTLAPASDHESVY